MHAKNTIINDCRKTQIVKYLTAVSPNINRAVLSQAFVIEAIDLSDLARFMVPSDKSEAIRIADLQHQKIGH